MATARFPVKGAKIYFWLFGVKISLVQWVEQKIGTTRQSMNTELVGYSTDSLGIRFHLTDGSVHSFVQTDEAAAQKLWADVDPVRIFARPRIVVSNEHSKTVFVTAEIVRVDFLQDSLSCWNFPGGYSDIVELSELEFRQHAHLDEPALMSKREKGTSPGDLLVSFVRIQMRGSRPFFAMIELPAKLPAESQSYMQFMLSKTAVYMRLRGGGIGVLNLANLAGYTVYPGLPQIPADAWLAEPEQSLAAATL